MKTVDLLTSAIGNTFRSKTRTILTVLAIFVGAFTLTITNGLGTGINRYIDDTVAAIGAGDVMTVTKVAENEADAGDGPREYDPNAVDGGPVPGPPGSTSVVAPIATTQLDELAAIDGVERVQPVKSVDADYIVRGDGTKYEIGVGSFVYGMRLQLAAGEQPDAAASDLEIVIPDSYVDALGFDDADAAIGESVTVAVTDAVRAQHAVEATVVGVSEPGLGTNGSAVPNDALTDALFEAQSTGSSDEAGTFTQATVWFDPDATPEQLTALEDRLTDAGYDSTTVEEQLGTFKAVIDGIVLVLNAFAIIALLAASFGIVNTLLMSVQERTREIGLMKAMGMGSGKVFGLFSLEAVFIGFLGSAIGAGIGMLVGTAASSALSGALLSDLPGLTLIAFDPLSISVIILVVMAVAFIAGTLPAARAARQDPVESLGYE